MKVFGLIFRLAAIIFGILVTAVADNDLVAFGCSIYVIEMIIVFINMYIYTVPYKFVLLVVDIALTIPSLCFFLYFLSISSWLLAGCMIVLNFIGIVKAYNLYKFK
jgi:hypothetical protein